MIKQLVHFVLLLTSLFGFGQQQSNQVKLLFLGDIMGHGPQIKASYNTVSKTYDYEPNYHYLTPLLQEADICLANLEVTLGVPPYKGYPQFSSPPELVKAAQNAGIDVLVTANNHSCDKRRKGIEKTISILDSLQIPHTGTFKNQKEKERLYPLILEKNTIKIAFLNYTYGTNGIPVPKPNVVNILDKKTIINDVAKTKALKPDVIIAFVHWGSEYRDLPSADQKKWFNFFKSQGVQIVIGSHPHVVEPMYWNKDDGSLVVYSLGNFVSNQRKFPRDGGALFALTLTKSADHTFIYDAGYHTTWVYKQISKNEYEVGHSGTRYFVLPVDEFTYKPSFFSSVSDYNKMMTYSKHARGLFDKHNLNTPEKRPFSLLLEQLLFVSF